MWSCVVKYRGDGLAFENTKRAPFIQVLKRSCLYSSEVKQCPYVLISLVFFMYPSLITLHPYNITFHDKSRDILIVWPWPNDSLTLTIQTTLTKICKIQKDIKYWEKTIQGLWHNVRILIIPNLKLQIHILLYNNCFTCLIIV